jgi:hypothetical protein
MCRSIAGISTRYSDLSNPATGPDDVANGGSGRKMRSFNPAGASAAVYLKQLCDAGVLEEVRAGREKLFINPRLMRLLTAEKPVVPPFTVRARAQ